MFIAVSEVSPDATDPESVLCCCSVLTPTCCGTWPVTPEQASEEGETRSIFKGRWFWIFLKDSPTSEFHIEKK